MDLAVSPDLDAFWCYLIVLFFGAVTAIGQVRARLGNLRGIWVTLSAWLLFLGYWAVPVVLFWFLDRTGAINDTSVFAALLVGVGYQQILAGSLQQVKAPGDVSRFWQPFLAWADRVAQRVLDRVRLNAQRFKGKVIDGIVGNDGRFDALKQLALAGAPEPQAVKTELDKIAALKPLLDDASVHGKQADYLYRTIAQVPDFQFLLKEQGITSRWDYFVYALEGRSIIVALVVALLALGGTAYGAWRLSRPTVMCDYYAWRLEKVKTTPLDQFRARQSLAAFLSNQATAQQTH